VVFARLRRGALKRLFVGLYRTGQWVYDPLTSVFFGQAWHNWRRTVLPFVGPGAALEIACGTGQLLPELASRSSYVVGFDRSESMLQPAKKRARGPKISLVMADATTLPFGNSAFETVVSTFPANFIASDSVLEEVSRVLMPGGRFVVVVSARFTRFQWKRPFIHPILRVAYGSHSSMNRWPKDLLKHPLLPGDWQGLRTADGEAFVWIATRIHSQAQ
jgi:ubiquinone/menaquinone biosynthesis C-methylase UbiE